MSGARGSPRKGPDTAERVPERRFSDILEEDAGNHAPNKRPRRPRKTLREEVADDLVFIRMTPQAQATGSVSYTHLTLPTILLV